jgi:NAD(P)-dependent dehydrogenase (short-subunit alcohol dehydrogenase family)
VDDACKRIAGVAAGGGGVAGAYVHDFDHLEGVRGLAEDVLANHPTLDVLVNNAGVGRCRLNR